MGAPKGNQFWKLRSKHGRDKLFASPELMKEAIDEYFQWCIDNPLLKTELVKYKDYYELVEVPISRPFTFQGLCLYLGCNTKYFFLFEDNNKDGNDFSYIITYAREIIYNQKYSGAATNIFNANIIARDLGLIDKVETKAKIQIGEYDSLTEQELRDEIERLK